MKSKRLTAVALACAVSPVIVLPTLVSGAAPSPAAQAAAAALPPESRVAFTDERDQILVGDVTLAADLGEITTTSGVTADPGPPLSLLATELGFSNRPVHEGEMSIEPDTDEVTWVSTVDSPEGEVYYAPPGFDGDLERVTCDPGVETHPVPGSERVIAYASNSDGDWDIYLAVGNGGEGCDGWDITNLTPDSPGDDLWPSIVYTVAGDSDLIGIVYSTAEQGELPDLAMIVNVDEEEDLTAFGPPMNLTNSPGYAETQPAVSPDFGDGSPVVVAYTSNEERSEGSIRMLEPFEDTPSWSPWLGSDDPPASSEATWIVTPEEILPYVAFTSRDRDPYGDIDSVRYNPAVDDDPAFFSNRTRVFNTPGVAETHAVWLDEFGLDPVDLSNRIGYTARALHNDIDPTDIRVLDADVSDVRVDGADRRVLLDDVDIETEDEPIRADEAGPDYSPDGSQIAYSRQLGVSNGPAPLGREIWIANADGTDAVSLAEITGHEPLDRDRDPVWSPDGTRIAFVRESIPASTASTGTPRVYVVDLTDDSLIAVTPPSNFDAPGEDLDFSSWWDTDPDWSPDGETLVLRRNLSSNSVDRPPPGWTAVAQELAARGETIAHTDDTLWVVPVQANSVGVQVESCPEDCFDISGRHPAWAPDGSAIVFVNQGALVLGTIQENDDPSDTFFLVETENITGPPWNGNTTEGQAALSYADNPAWAPDSSEIAFSGQPMGQPDQRGIYRILPDGTGLAVIADERGPETEPTYQPTPQADVAVTAAVAGSPASVGAPLSATFTVTNLGPQTALGVVLATALSPGATIISATTASGPPVVCAADGTGCTIGSLPVDGVVTYVVTFSHPVPVAAGTVTATVTSTSEDPVPANNTATATYQVMLVAPPVADLAVFLGIDKPTGYVGGKRIVLVRVRNLGPQIAQGAKLIVSWPAGVVASSPVPGPDPLTPPLKPTPACLPAGLLCSLGNIAPGTDALYRVVLTTATEGDFTLTAKVNATTIDPVLPNNTDTLELPVLQPAIRLVPSVARPGQVVLAYGENMPPSTQVVLSWGVGEGLPIHAAPITVLADGTIRRPVLILRREQLGDRTITATSTTEEFTPVTGDILIVLRSLSPPDLVGRG